MSKALERRRSGLLPYLDLAGRRHVLSAFVITLLLLLSVDVRSSELQDGPEFQAVSPNLYIGYPDVLFAQDTFGLEWWYVTGHLSDGDARFGFELTFFRVGVSRSPQEDTFSVSNLYFAHLGITDIGQKRFYYAERSSRGALGEAGARSDRLDVWLSTWRLHGTPTGMVLSAEDPGFGVGLDLRPLKPPIYQGRRGYSQKGMDSNEASFYVSLSRVRADGRLRIKDREFDVSGTAWMDREIMTPLRESGDARGWDWFAIQLDDGREVMLYRIHTEEKVSEYSAGTLILEDGGTVPISYKDFLLVPTEVWRSPETGVRYDTAWEVHIPSYGISLRVSAFVAAQEFIARRSTGNVYWEGACAVTGSWSGRTVNGKAYLEMNRSAVPAYSSP